MTPRVYTRTLNTCTGCGVSTFHVAVHPEHRAWIPWCTTCSLERFAGWAAGYDAGWAAAEAPPLRLENDPVFEVMLERSVRR